MRGSSEAKRVPASEALRDIRAAQLKALFRQMPIALAVNVVNAAITTIVLQRFVLWTIPFAWFCIVSLVTLGRGAIWQQYRQTRTVEDISYWSLLAACGSLIAGLTWGLGGAVLFSLVPSFGQIFLTFVIGGMCADAVVLSASHFATLVAFLLAATLPMAARFIYEGTVTGNALAAMILVFAAALSLAGGYLNRVFAETMRLRFELYAANLRLQSETRERQATEAALRQAQKLEAIGPTDRRNRSRFQQPADGRHRQSDAGAGAFRRQLCCYAAASSCAAGSRERRWLAFARRSRAVVSRGAPMQLPPGDYVVISRSAITEPVWMR